jgi:site-specific recombinase XerD
VLDIEARHYHIDPRRGPVWIIEADEVNESQNKLAIYDKRRIIYLQSKKVRQLVEELNRQYPTGPLLRNERGEKWTTSEADQRFKEKKEFLNKRLRKEGKPEIPKKVTLYGYRHRFAINFLREGGSIAHLAELFGDRVAMVEQHYGHVGDQGDVLRKALEDFGPKDNED